MALGLTPTLPALGGLPASFGPRIAQALEACDLLEHREQPATTLSGGELARAMLARALVADPDVLIIDEPIAGLDPRHALDTAHRLKELAKSGKLVIASIHDLTLAGRYASRIFALSNGRVQGDGATATTLTPALIRSAFDVEACVSGAPGGVYVDYALPPLEWAARLRRPRQGRECGGDHQNERADAYFRSQRASKQDRGALLPA